MCKATCVAPWLCLWVEIHVGQEFTDVVSRLPYNIDNNDPNRALVAESPVAGYMTQTLIHGTPRIKGRKADKYTPTHTYTPNTSIYTSRYIFSPPWCTYAHKGDSVRSIFCQVAWQIELLLRRRSRTSRWIWNGRESHLACRLQRRAPTRRRLSVYPIAYTYQSKGGNMADGAYQHSVRPQCITEQCAVVQFRSSRAE